MRTHIVFDIMFDILAKRWAVPGVCRMSEFRWVPCPSAQRCPDLFWDKACGMGAAVDVFVGFVIFCFLCLFFQARRSGLGEIYHERSDTDVPTKHRTKKNDFLS